ncbi:MAG: hypothetical protein QF565_13685 [Arenicellales bacterium]|nr:hypothetical protein [Arenicellales bacterium]
MRIVAVHECRTVSALSHALSCGQRGRFCCCWHAQRREVSLGHFDERGAEVSSGIDERELVVLHPSDRVSDETRISKRPNG